MNAVSEDLSFLEKVQLLDVSQLVRQDELGAAYNFSPALEGLEKTVKFFRRIVLGQLKELPQHFIDEVNQQANQFYDLIERIRSFDAKIGNAPDVHASLISEANVAYYTYFERLNGIVAFLASVSVDFDQVSRKAENSISGAISMAKEATADVGTLKLEAEKALTAIRSIAAERGVSQQADYFNKYCEFHDKERKNWLKYTIWISIVLGLYSFALIVVSYFYYPSSSYQAIQISIGKILVFSVIAYMLFLSSRTYSAHQHNYTVNKHRYNSLLSFNALVSATGSEESRNIVLASMANSIFSPQDTGYISANSGGLPLMKFIEAVPRTAGNS